MDILETKEGYNYSQEISKLFNKLQFKNFPIELKGSSNLKSQHYFSDYDLMSIIDKKISILSAYKEFKKILKNIEDSDNYYFIEMKLETNDGQKKKWFLDDRFDYNSFKKYYKKINFFKIDIILWENNIFTEASCIYFFTFDKSEENNEDIEEKSLRDDIDELEKEGKYYKVLKRKFNLYKIKDDKSNLLKLTKIFNSELGELYRKKSNLEAIKLLYYNYDDKLTNERILLNLNEIGEIGYSSINKKIEQYDKFINEKAKQLNKKFKI
jgi:hypothetical protein